MSDKEELNSGCLPFLSIAISFFAIVLSCYSIYEVKKQNKIENEYAEKNFNLQVLELNWKPLLENDTQSIEKSLKLLETLEPSYSAKIIKPFKSDSLIYSKFKKQILKIDSAIIHRIFKEKTILIRVNSKERNFGNVIEREIISQFEIPSTNISKRYINLNKSAICEYRVLYNIKITSEEIQILKEFLIFKFNNIHFNFEKNSRIEEDFIFILC